MNYSIYYTRALFCGDKRVEYSRLEFRFNWNVRVRSLSAGTPPLLPPGLFPLFSLLPVLTSRLAIYGKSRSHAQNGLSFEQL